MDMPADDDDVASDFVGLPFKRGEVSSIIR